MSQDPLALPAFSAGSPHEAEYDAVYAAVTATERGRWFLTEYASRNRNVDTQSVVAAIARIEAAVRDKGAPQVSAATAWRDLTGIATTIERTRAALAAERIMVSDLGAAVERILDITFGLRERAVDAALCDALENAARKISAGYAACATQGTSAHAVTDLLRDLAGRIAALIALSPTDEASRQIAIEASAAPVTDLSAASVREVESVVTNPAAGVDPPVAPIVMNGEANHPVTEQKSSTHLLDAAFAPEPQSAAREGTVTVIAELATSQKAPSAEGSPRWRIEAPDFLFQIPDAGAKEDPVELSEESGKPHALLPDTQLQQGSSDDPASLEAEMPAAAQSGPAEAEAPLDVSPPPIRIVNGPAMLAMPRPVPNDPLADMGGLNAEELIALFG